MESLRDCFGQAFVEAGHKYKNVVGVSCDLKEATRMSPFFKNFPSRSFEVGIAEANAIGIATGLGLSGFRPVISCFGAFISGKNIEIRTSISYNNSPVLIIGTHGGLIGPDGATQSGLQDISVMRSIPNFQIFQPSSPNQTRAIIDYSCEVDDLIYVRVARNTVPEIYRDDYIFKPKNAHVVKEGNEIVIFSSGPVVHECISAANILSNNFNIKVCDIPSLKPINEEFVIEHLQNCNMAFTVEDHDIQGGLGSLISEVITDHGLNNKLYRHGLKDQFIESGKPKELERLFNLDPEGIVKIIKRELNK